MSSIRKSSTKRSDDTMDDDSDDKDSKRKSRNLSEKKRRDQFNMLVNELSTMVATGSRKMDKSTVLKSTIAFLKHHNEVAVRSHVNEIQEDWKPSFLTNEEFTHLVLEAIDGFIMVFSASGQIYYASESITSLLGYLPSDVLNMTIYDLVYDEEHSNLYNKLLSPSDEQGNVSFSCHLRCGDPVSKQNSSFELIHFVGYFKSDENIVQTKIQYSEYSDEGDIRLVFVGTGRVSAPRLIREMPIVDCSKSEFTSRHSLEWKFLFLDHRAPPIIGYLPFELLGTSGYDYYHIDDLDNIICCHEALMQKGEGTSCYYRFLTKGQQWLWVQTRFYITYHQWNSKPEFVVCTHRVVNYGEILKHFTKGDVSHINLPMQSPNLGNSVNSFTWPTKNSRSSIRHDAPSDCTSMSADSLTSRQSGMTQHSVKSKSNHTKPYILLSPQSSLHELQPLQQVPVQQCHQEMQPPQHYMEPQQYVAAIPVQPMISSFSPSAVISPLQTLDNVILTPAQAQVQLDLQRKHAELQALIGQQQAELRRVSEQLLMAKLGIMPNQQNLHVQNFLPQTTLTYQSTGSGTVSSTTIQNIETGATISSPMIVPVTIPLPSALSHHHYPQNVLYNTSDLNEQSK